MSEQELMDAAQLDPLANETTEGRSIVVLAKEKHGHPGRRDGELGVDVVPFTAQTRMSGVDESGMSIRKGAVDAMSTPSAWLRISLEAIDPAPYVLRPVLKLAFAERLRMRERRGRTADMSSPVKIVSFSGR